MKFVSPLLAAALLACATPALSHPGHDEDIAPIARPAAEAEAQRAVQAMVRRKMLDASWTGQTPVEAELRHDEQGHRWRVVFRNAKGRDATQRALFVFLRADGKYLAFNHTGK